MSDSRFDLDNLARLLATPGGTRRSLLAGVAGGVAAAAPWTAASGKKKRCKKSKKCGRGCCNAGSCFAKKIDPFEREPLGFACCPEKLLCKTTNPNWELGDVCCYPDETCQPSLIEDPLFQTICCRPCNGVCCPNQNDECIDNVCTPIDTARLPRTRRP